MRGRRHRAVGAAIDWAAWGRGVLLVGSASWLRVDPRLWRRGERVRSAILEHVASERVPKGERAVVAGTQAIEQPSARHAAA